jgi:WD40 repeat protein
MEPGNDTKKPAWPTSPAKLVVTLKGHGEAIVAMAFTPDRSLLATSSRDAAGRLWDVGGAPRERAILGTHGDRFQSFAFAPNGRMLAAGSGALNGYVRLIDVSDKAPKEVAVLKGARGSVDALAFSPDGKLVAGAGEDRTLRVWEATPGSKGDPRTQLPGHTKPVRALAFAPDGQGVATAANDSTVRIWSLSRIRSWERASLPHKGEVNSVAWSADGKTVATAGQDGFIRLWDPTAMKPVPRNELVGHAGPIRLLLITPDSRTLVSVGDGPRVMHWDVPSGLPLREWQVDAGPVVAVALTPDGRYLATGATDGTVGVYRVAEKRA